MIEMAMRLDGCPSAGKIYCRAQADGSFVFYVEVRGVGVLTCSAVGRPIDGRLQLQGGKLLSLQVLDRLEARQTPLPPRPREMDADEPPHDQA